MFVNYSNHPSSKWSVEQKEAASVYGEIVDIPFPAVSSIASSEAITDMATAEVTKIITALTSNPLCEGEENAVMCQGEFTLSFLVTCMLINCGKKVVSACSERVTEEKILPSGEVEKIINFKFVQFREYVHYPFTE
jgi:hypothetical protein